MLTFGFSIVCDQACMGKKVLAKPAAMSSRLLRVMFVS
jgi:hypothetical protein